MGRRGYPTEFRQRVLDLVAAGRKVVDLARELGVSDQTIYTRRRRDHIDRGLVVGRCAVELLMHVAGLAGVSWFPRFRRAPRFASAGDLVGRGRSGEDQDVVLAAGDHDTGHSRWSRT
jgi:hypothetical protein